MTITMTTTAPSRNGTVSSLSRRNFDSRQILPSKQVPMRSISYHPSSTSNTPNMPHKYLRSSSPSKIPTTVAIRPKQKTAPLPSPPPSPKPIRRSVSERRISTGVSENGSASAATASHSHFHSHSNLPLSSKLPRRSASGDQVESLTIQTPQPVEAFDPASIVPVFSNSAPVKHSPLLTRKELSPVTTVTPVPRTPTGQTDHKIADFPEKAAQVKSPTPEAPRHPTPKEEKKIKTPDVPEVHETRVQIHHPATSPVKPMPSAVLTQNGVTLKTQVRKTNLLLKSHYPDPSFSSTF